MTNDEARQTREVIEAHLRRRAEQNLEADLAEHYSPDVVLLSAEGVNRGHDGVRRLAQVLHRYLGSDGRWEGTRLEVHGRFALLEWRGHADDHKIHDGADTFVVEKGVIVAQTIHYSTKP